MSLPTMTKSFEKSLPVSSDLLYDWRWMVRTILGQRLVVLVFPAIAIVLAIAYVIYRPAEYTATSTLNVTNLRLTLSRDDAFFAELQFDPTFLETQIQIISSESVLTDLLGKIEIEGVPSNLPERTQDNNETFDIRAVDVRALEEFRRPLNVQRVGMSNLVNVSYTASDPNRAAEVANAFTNAYITKLELDRLEAAEAASSWLRERLQDVGPKAQVVSVALPPIHKSSMRGIVIIAAAAVVGTAVGVIAALGVALIDNRVRSPEQILDALGVPCFGIVPTLAPDRGSDGAMFREALDQPMSPLWHALRHIDIALQEAGKLTKTRLIGITSTVAGEGKTTIAANFAIMQANAGKRVLMVDAQPYNMSLSRLLAPTAGRGLSDMLRLGDGNLSFYVKTDRATGLDFLPLGGMDAPERTAQLLWSDAMTKFMPSFEGYDLVVFDLPPMVAVGDLYGAARMLHSFILVVEWGKPTSEALRTAMVMNPLLHAKLGGALLNKADQSRMRQVFSPFASLLMKQPALSATARLPYQGHASS
ncbi:AAA family ATPase [Rhizobiaceae bacterium BDR2-2]|uniref:AAA family ATPase n=1 Tax=Ectorhizobium quercum TaxID=2965071 RepID=A0AAE3MX30_9HYPH|nr:tyrosine-protein kinase domain-containing protein [Ectorhizobium quercum]MCX8995866.1 AAA family ATPase [Ectorhizobium quercum]